MSCLSQQWFDFVLFLYILIKIFIGSPNTFLTFCLYQRFLFPAITRLALELIVSDLSVTRNCSLKVTTVCSSERKYSAKHDFGRLNLLGLVESGFIKAAGISCCTILLPYKLWSLRCVNETLSFWTSSCVDPLQNLALITICWENSRSLASSTTWYPSLFPVPSPPWLAPHNTPYTQVAYPKLRLAVIYL